MTGEWVWEYQDNAPLWGGGVARKVSYLNQGGTLWTVRLPRELAAAG